MRAVCAVERAVLAVLRPDLRLVLDFVPARALERVVVLPDLCVAVEDVFFFFLVVVELLLLLSVVLWPDTAYNAGEAETARATARVSAPAKRLRREREVGEFCTLIYPL